MVKKCSTKKSPGKELKRGTQNTSSIIHLDPIGFTWKLSAAMISTVSTTIQGIMMTSNISPLSRNKREIDHKMTKSNTFEKYQSDIPIENRTKNSIQLIVSIPESVDATKMRKYWSKMRSTEDDRKDENFIQRTVKGWILKIFARSKKETMFFHTLVMRGPVGFLRSCTTAS